MTLSDGRKNIGGVCSPQIPRDRYIVAAVFVLMDDDGNFTTYTHHQPRMAGLQSVPLPADETLMDVGDLVAQAWSLSTLQTTEE